MSERSAATTALTAAVAATATAAVLWTQWSRWTKGSRRSRRPVFYIAGGNPAMEANQTRPASPTSSSATTDKNVFKFVLTGGPCAGKSTAIVEVADLLRSLGYNVYTIPELATLFHHSGVHFPAGKSFTETLGWDAAKLQAQMALEDSYYSYALKTNTPTVLLCDRGAMDTKAYMRPEDFQSIMDSLGYNEVYLRDKRYDAVCHLVTAANGAEAYYSKGNNAARRESMQEACALDRKTHNAWLGHAQLRIVDNATDFQTKVLRVKQFFCQFLDAPRPHASCRRFFVRISPNVDDTIHARSQLTSTFLHDTSWDNSEGDVVLRRRGQHGAYTYSISLMQRKSEGHEVITTERTINSHQYAAMLSQANPAYRTVHRQRRCFVWNQEYFELDVVSSIDGADKAGAGKDGEEWWRVIARDKSYGVLIANSDRDEVKLPECVTLVKEITKEYALEKLARK